MILMVIWSKDRAMQCDALLRSCAKCASGIFDIKVIWTASSKDLESGYDKLVNKWNASATFIKQSNFKADLINILESSDSEYFLGNSDDNLFINYMPQGFDPDLKDDEAAVSLRLSPLINYCQPASLSISSPEAIARPPFYAIRWEDADPRGCWGYPNPCDSNIYRKEWFLDIIKNAEFENPRQLELLLNASRSRSKPIVKFSKKSVLVNVCNNCVVNSGNPCGSDSIEYLNSKWLSGNVIDADDFFEKTYLMCHVMKPYKFIEVENA